jgi:hypothetical protein
LCATYDKEKLYSSKMTVKNLIDEHQKKYSDEKILSITYYFERFKDRLKSN